MAESTEFISVIRIDTGETEKMRRGMHTLFVRIGKDFDKNIREALEALSPRLADAIRKNFRAKGARGGHEPWQIVHNPKPLIDKDIDSDQ